MLEAFYATERGSLEDITINGDFDLHPDLVWLDLIAPSQRRAAMDSRCLCAKLTDLKITGRYFLECPILP